MSWLSFALTGVPTGLKKKPVELPPETDGGLPFDMSTILMAGAAVLVLVLVMKK